MFLKAGAISLLLLVCSRLLGLARESAQAAAFGTTGLGDVAVLMLTLPDWLAGLLASGALAYVLLPHWAQQGPAGQGASQRMVARALLAQGLVLGLAIWIGREPLLALLAAGLAPEVRPLASASLGWSALALPAALLAALWATRLQHERDFTGMYGANLVVNGVLVVALFLIAFYGHPALGLVHLGWIFLGAMLLRLLWLRLRLSLRRGVDSDAVGGGELSEARRAVEMPAASVWLWAVASAGLPLALPFVARSLASRSGEGALATFNYAWKLVELPLVLAIQLVATLAFPAITRAFANAAVARPGAVGNGEQAVRAALALAWTLACAAVAGLLLAAPAVTQVLFGWGRMGPDALARIAAWGAAGAWGLLPQALIAVALTVLATQGRLRWAAGAYALALAGLLAGAGWAGGDGARLMVLINAVLTGVAMVSLGALGRSAWRWLPLRLMGLTTATLVAAAGVQAGGWLPSWTGQGLASLLLAVAVAGVVIAVGWLGGPELRQALRR